MALPYSAIEREFNETFGYLRQDIAAIRRAELGLNYTVALLVCCGCEMLAFHRDLRPDTVLGQLLPNDERYRIIAKKAFEALRNGLAHKFRPNNIKMPGEEWRFTLAWRSGPHVSLSRGEPNWLRLNVKILSDRLDALINAYENELRTDEAARVNFLEKSRSCVVLLPESAKAEVAAWRWMLSQG